MTGPEPATPAEAGPGGDPVPPADPVPPGDPVPPVEPAPSPDAVPAAATAAGTRALRHQFDAEAKTALAELLAAGGGRALSAQPIYALRDGADCSG